MTPSRLGELPTVSSYQDWEESLEERPKPEPRYKMGNIRWMESTVMDTSTNHELTMGEILDLLNEREQ
jgi:hypothetical protein